MTAQMMGTDVEILGQELVDLGYNVKEYDDHTVCPRFKEKDLAAYPQTGVEAAELKRVCQQHKERANGE